MILKTNEDTAPQSREFLQTFVWGGAETWIFPKWPVSKVEKKKKQGTVYSSAAKLSRKNNSCAQLKFSVTLFEYRVLRNPSWYPSGN